MRNAERVAEAWRDREFAEKFIGSLGADDRVAAYKMVDSETGNFEETYILSRPAAGATPIFMSGDCEAVRQAIDSRLLESVGEGIYKRSGSIG